MARIYAQVTDLPDYPGGDTLTDPTASLLLRIASGIVDRCLVGRRYPHDANAMPTDEDDIQAMKDATCLIAIEANAAGIGKPGESTEWGQVAIGNVSLSNRQRAEGVTLVDGVPVPVLAAQSLLSVGARCVRVI
ncbi:hypothetical protein SAMN05428985_11038 [Nocardioides sp. YR527]|uniref:hypothetical protein n=1 Tax=Nocardioides sp. YR527 TaxID=1881028 RepID=UPI000881CD8B|nr:hypothetical protein [Nocardioides sp. YR527]SDL14464.1 hypothetical protein SAMN05428985_11038 [Nocardioides sp. YR527]